MRQEIFDGYLIEIDIIDSTALGVMRMDMVIPLTEVLRCFKVLVGWATITYVLLIPYFLIRKLFRKQK